MYSINSEKLNQLFAQNSLYVCVYIYNDTWEHYIYTQDGKSDVIWLNPVHIQYSTINGNILLKLIYYKISYINLTQHTVYKLVTVHSLLPEADQWSHPVQVQIQSQTPPAWGEWQTQKLRHDSLIQSVKELWSCINSKLSHI